MVRGPKQPPHNQQRVNSNCSSCSYMGGPMAKTDRSCVTAIMLRQFILLTQVLVLTLMQWLLFAAYTLLLLGLILHCQLFTYLAPRMPWPMSCLAIIFHNFFSITHRPADIHSQSLLQLSASYNYATAQLDLASLERHVQHYFHAALSKNTQHSYSAAHHRYINFCSRSGLIAYASSEDALCRLNEERKNTKNGTFMTTHFCV